MHDDVNGDVRDDNPAALLPKDDRPLHTKRLVSVLKTDTILDNAYFSIGHRRQVFFFFSFVALMVMVR
jgi:hypothetical protein